jgi:hypothetical protein
LALSLLRTNSAANSGQQRITFQYGRGFRKFLVGYRSDKSWDINEYGTTSDARLILASEASFRLENRLFPCVALGNFIDIASAYARLLRRHFL